MRRLYPLLLIVSASLLLTAPSLATPPPTYNRVTLNESASTDVQNDRLVIVLFAQADGRAAREPADEVNRAMDWALAITGQHEQIQAQTLGYQTSPIYKDGKIRGWRVRQSLRIEGSDSRLLGDLTGQLQAQLSVQSIDYRVSDERRRETLARLTDTALGHFTARAKRMAEALGRGGYRLVSLNVNDGQDRPPPVMRAMAAEARGVAAPAPATFAVGSQRLTVSIRGEIELAEE